MLSAVVIALPLRALRGRGWDVVANGDIFVILLLVAMEGELGEGLMAGLGCCCCC